MKDVAAIFDVDGTLLKENTMLLYLKSLYKDNRISLFVLLRSFYYDLKYKMNMLTFEEMSGFGLGFMQGWSYSELERYSKIIFEVRIRSRLSEKMLKIIKDHQKKKHKIILLTNSPQIIAEKIGDFLKADKIICSRIKVADDKILGGFQQICYGENKLNLLLNEKNLDLKRSYFYSDGYSDLAVLEEVGNPVAVNPDKKLERYAEKKGWDILRY